MNGCEAYLDDDIVIYSDSWEEHVEQVKTVFQKLTDTNPTINLAKCELVHATVVYLGKMVGNGHVKPVGSKIEAIATFPTPPHDVSCNVFLECRVITRVSVRTFQLLLPLSLTWLPQKLHLFGHWNVSMLLSVLKRS